MPVRAPSACRRPGCPGLVRDGVCSRCGPLRQAQDDAPKEDRRGSRHERGYDWRWEKLRPVALARDLGLCCQCGRPAELVDHIVPIRDGGERLDLNNLQSLCRACHDIKTADDLRRRRAGGV